MALAFEKLVIALQRIEASGSRLGPFLFNHTASISAIGFNTISIRRWNSSSLTASGRRPGAVSFSGEPSSDGSLRDVRFGSLAEMASRPRHVCSFPQSRHSSARVARPLCAKKRTLQRLSFGGRSALLNYIRGIGRHSMTSTELPGKIIKCG